MSARFRFKIGPLVIDQGLRGRPDRPPAPSVMTGRRWLLVLVAAVVALIPCVLMVMGIG